MSSVLFGQRIELTSLTNDEEFIVGSVTGINDSNTDSSDYYDFTAGGTLPGLFFEAGDGIFLAAAGPAGSSVGVVSLNIEVVPEPTSSLLLGLGFLTLLTRRRK